MSDGDGERRRPSRQEMAEHLGFLHEVARAVLRRRRLPRKGFLDDAVQDGFEGLVRALQRFDPNRGASFETFATPLVSGAILDALRARRKGDPVQRLMLRGADQAAADWAARHGAAEEVSTAGAGRKAAREGIEGYLAALGFGYLGAIRRLDPERALAAQRLHALALTVVPTLLARLAHREQVVLQLRTVDELPWDEVAERMQRPRTTVQHWHDTALDRLRAGLVERGIDEMPSLPDREDDEEEEE